MAEPSKTLDNDAERRLGWCLLAMRLSVGLVFAMWTIDKFLHPDHAAAVFEKFYMIPSLSSTLAYVVGSLQAIVVVAFIAGAFQRFSYVIIFVLHAISTFSSYSKYLDPWTYPNLLFFAAIPMLTACWALWLLRDYDAIFSFDHRRGHAARE